MIPDNTGTPFTINIECLIDTRGGVSIYEVGRQLKTWLNLNDWARLIFSDDPQYYYEAVLTNEIRITELRDKQINTITLQFLCKPMQGTV